MRRRWVLAAAFVRTTGEIAVAAYVPLDLG